MVTGTQRELGGINLLDKTCPMEFVITVEALKQLCQAAHGGRFELGIRAFVLAQIWQSGTLPENQREHIKLTTQENGSAVM